MCIRLPEVYVLFTGNNPALLYDLFIQLVISRIGNVLFLNSSIYTNNSFLLVLAIILVYAYTFLLIPCLVHQFFAGKQPVLLRHKVLRVETFALR
jgi:hypothetical protein